MKCTFLLTAGALAATALGASHVHVGLETDVPIHDPRTSSWRLAGPPPAEEEMTLTVSLRVHPERRSKLEKVLFLQESTYWSGIGQGSESFTSSGVRSLVRGAL